MNGELYSPAFKDSILIVCGTRKDRVLHTHLDKNGKEPIDLYSIDLDSSHAFTRFDEKFRSDFHDGPISFNEEGDQCIISRNLHLDNRFKALQLDENQLGLFESRLENGVWTTPEPLLINNDGYNCTHPALSVNGDRLVFSSNMPGGFGGYDIWKIEKSNGTWGAPENLGSGVNSSSNEFFPTLIGTTIYFSANRKAFGGLDIYQVDGMGETANVRLLEEPLNSSKDDFGLISKTQGETGYFSSNRSGSDQLWSYEMSFPVFDDCDSLVNDDFCYTLLEETAYELGGIESLVYQWDINGVKKFGYEIDYCFPCPGEYVISVDIIDTIVKKTYANQASYTLELSKEEQPYITSPDSIQIGQEFALDPSKTYLPGVEIDFYYWIISDGTLFMTKNPTHTFEKLGEYQVTLGIIGTKYGEPFKDCSYKYVVATSEPIAQTPVAQVKIPMDTFEQEGQLTESDRPKMSSDSTVIIHSIEIAQSASQLSDSSDVLAPARENYRVNISYDSIFRYSVGEWLNISEAHDIWINMMELGYEDASIFTHERKLDKDLPLNSPFYLENVEFDNNKWVVREEAKENLGILVLLLKEYKDVRLLITAHTDNVGRTADNLVLSEKRANAILEYFFNTGIDKNRLDGIGLGDTKPRNSNDTQEGRSSNRRVEFKLITTREVEILQNE
jgi:outer membrane protein OmpA-like peptidoglycan-associated protein